MKWLFRSYNNLQLQAQTRQYLRAAGYCVQCQVQTEAKSNGNNILPQSIDSRDHMNRTQYRKRNDSIISASVTSLSQLSPTVKGLKLAVNKAYQAKAMFIAGQWLDLIIPDIETVGGFSICNSPGDFERDGLIELAVKFSDHPPAYWIHNKCEIGSKVKLRIGGDFCYKDSENSEVLLIAGGVGINPLLSILRHRRDIYFQDKDNSQHCTALLYSVKTEEQLIFESEIRRICAETPARCQFHLTQPCDPVSISPSSNVTVSHDKISRDSLHLFMKSRDTNRVDCYVCGPPKFIDDVKEHLIDLGCLEKNIFYEKWW